MCILGNQQLVVIFIWIKSSNHEIGDINDNTSFVITYVDEIRPVLACHAKPKVSPESSFLPHYLRQKEQLEISLSHTDDTLLFVYYFSTYQLLFNRR